MSIAIRQEQALGRLNSAAATLAERWGVAVPDIPKQGHDADLLRAAQFEALADWAEQVAEQTGEAELPISEAPPANAYEGMTKAELVLEARARKMDISSLKTKPELIDALQASDEMSEDAQAAMDHEEGE